MSAEPSVLRMPNRAQTGKHFSSRGLVFIFLGSVFSPSPLFFFLSSSLGFSFCLRVGGSFIILTFLFYFRSPLFYHIPTVLLLDLSNFHLRHVLLCYLPMNLTLNLILHLLALPHPHPHFFSLPLLIVRKKDATTRRRRKHRHRRRAATGRAAPRWEFQRSPWERERRVVLG